MYRAVHADRSGRVIVSDHAAAAFDGAATVPFADALPLPNDATVVPIEREAVTLDRAGRTHRAAAGRLAVAALVPPGHLRTQLPAYADAPGRPELAPRPYAAVAADDRGDLVVSAVVLDRDPTHDAEAYVKSDIAARVSDALRSRPADKLVRQLARCAREYGCRAAANAFYGRWECALPVAAPSNEDPVPSIAPRFDGEADPREPAVFHPTADEVAARADDPSGDEWLVPRGSASPRSRGPRLGHDPSGVRARERVRGTPPARRLSLDRRARVAPRRGRAAPHRQRPCARSPGTLRSARRDRRAGLSRARASGGQRAAGPRSRRRSASRAVGRPRSRGAARHDARARTSTRGRAPRPRRRVRPPAREDLGE